MSTDIIQWIYCVWFAGGGRVKFTLEIETVEPTFIAARDGEYECVSICMRE